MRFVDLSHVIRDGLLTYPGLPAPRITEHLSREDEPRPHAVPPRIEGMGTFPVRARSRGCRDRGGARAR
jgi:kynurenine formamidase